MSSSEYKCYANMKTTGNRFEELCEVPQADIIFIVIAYGVYIVLTFGFLGPRPSKCEHKFRRI